MCNTHYITGLLRHMWHWNSIASNILLQTHRYIDQCVQLLIKHVHEFLPCVKNLQVNVNVNQRYDNHRNKVEMSFVFKTRI